MRSSRLTKQNYWNLNGNGRRSLVGGLHLPPLVVVVARLVLMSVQEAVIPLAQNTLEKILQVLRLEGELDDLRVSLVVLDFEKMGDSCPVWVNWCSKSSILNQRRLLRLQHLRVPLLGYRNRPCHQLQAHVTAMVPWTIP